MTPTTSTEHTFMRGAMLTVLAGVVLAACLQAGSDKTPSVKPAFQRGFPGGPPPGGPGGPGGRGPGGMRQEQKIVSQFDTDGDKLLLSSAERDAARAWLRDQGAGFGGGRRGGGGGGRGFRGGPAGTPDPSPKLAVADIKTFPATAFYDIGTMRTIFFQFDNPDWEQELADFYNTDVEVPATLTVDGKVYKNVGVSYRGNSSYMMVPTGYKKSFNLSLDLVQKDQKVLGYHSLNLLNANHDPTFARVVLYSLIGRDFMPIPKANAVRVAVNGENRGVFINTQQYNKEFLAEWYGKDIEGARWKVPGSPGSRNGGLAYLGDSPGPYKAAYEIKSKDNAKSWASLIKLTRVLNETPLPQLEAALAPLLDIDETLRFLALDIAFVNSDGYWVRGSDYNLYEDASGKFHVIPHDFNEAFGAEEGRGGFGMGGGSGATTDPLVGLTDSSKPLRSRLLAIPSLRAKYLAYVRQIAERGMDWNTLGQIVAKYQSLIEPTVQADTRKLSDLESFKSGLGGPGAGENTLRGFIEQRRAFLLRYGNKGQ